MQSGAVIIILSFSFVVFLLFLFACVVVLQHYVVNEDASSNAGLNNRASFLAACSKVCSVLRATVPNLYSKIL